MKTLVGNQLYLRALEPEDLDVLFEIENNEDFWNVGETLVPYSKHLLKNYLLNAHKSIFDVGQLRLVICDKTTHKFIGLIDLFDFDAHNLRAGLGILIASSEARRKGHGQESLSLVMNYAKTHLKLHQLFANIEESNEASILLFEKMGFEQIGLKKDWYRKPSINGKEQYINEYLYQHIL